MSKRKPLSTHDDAPLKEVAKVMRALLANASWKAVYYISPSKVIRATRRWYAHSKRPAATGIEVLVSIGKPNYLERAFIKTCQKAGEPFPVKKVQLKQRVFRGK